MKRTIALSDKTQLLYNAILDLEDLTSRVYGYVRDEFCPDDQPEDKTGEDVLNASNDLRDVIEHYLHDRINTSLMEVKTIEGERVAL